ncbi:hypothetical protein SNE40_001949 [Patella caerulea]|uniref:Uncharacterized protein n=1 Tax=Patella caerulea TaxID=87958 RepID=A0AAN8PYG8_PATCE
MNPFWKDVLNAWADYVLKVCKTHNGKCTQIALQPLWFNADIKLYFIKDWYHKGIRNICDILEENGTFKTFEKLKIIYKLKGTSYQYEALKRAIPKEWKLSLLSQYLSPPPQPTRPIPVEFLFSEQKRCKHVYTLLTENDSSSVELGKNEIWWGKKLCNAINKDI